jgi:hypothetical protein
MKKGKIVVYKGKQFDYITPMPAIKRVKGERKMKKAKQTLEQITRENLHIALEKVLEVAQSSVATPEHIMTAAIALDMEPWFVEGAYFDYLDANEAIAAQG